MNNSLKTALRESMSKWVKEASNIRQDLGEGHIKQGHHMNESFGVLLPLPSSPLRALLTLRANCLASVTNEPKWWE